MPRLIPSILLVPILAAAGCGSAEGGSEAGSGPAAGTSAAPGGKKPAIVVTEGLPAQTVGPLVIQPGGFDLGKIEPNAVYEARLTLRNAGQQPITIIYTSVDCQCTVPEDLDGTVIEPGQTIPFSATFTARAAPGAKSAKMLMNFDYGGRMNKALIKIEGDVTMAVEATPPYVDALKGVTTGTVAVRSTDGRPFRIISAFGAAPVHADGYDPARDTPRSAYTLRWNVAFPTEEACDTAKLWWVVETDHPDCPVLPLRIRHECTGLRTDQGYKERGWLFKEYMANVGTVTAGEPIDVDVGITRLGSRATAGVYAVESLDPDATAELVEVIEPPDDNLTTCRVRFTPREGYEGMLYAMVNFKSETGEKDVAFLARVEE